MSMADMIAIREKNTNWYPFLGMHRWTGGLEAAQEWERRSIGGASVKNEVIASWFF